MQETKNKLRLGSPVGLAIMVALGFVFYFGLAALENLNLSVLLDYNAVVADISGKGALYWFFMNFTEPNFFAGFLSSILILVGAAVAWLLAIKGSKYRGFEICYGSARMWPWVFASQIISLVLTLYVFNYLSLFETGATWIPTFIVIVNVPPALMLMYGPGIPTLLTTTVLGSLICTPIAWWLSNSVFAAWNIPGVVSNVSAMAIAGFIAAAACHVLPWIKPVAVKPVEPPKDAKPDDVYSASWLVRRSIADFTEPLFYGSDVAGIFLLIGVVLDCTLNRGLSVYGAGVMPALVLSELVAAGLGVFLYAGRWEDKGWYATYVPVVSSAPACVLMFGGGLDIALFSAVLGAVIGAPLAEYVGDHMPSYVPGTVANVTAMAITTVITCICIQSLPFLG